MGIFGKPNIDKLKSKGDVKALHKVLLDAAHACDAQNLSTTPNLDRLDASIDLVTDAAVALLDLDATDVLRQALLHEIDPYQIRYISRALAGVQLGAGGGWVRIEGKENQSRKACPLLYDLWLHYENPSAWTQKEVRGEIRDLIYNMPRAWLDARTVAALIAVLRVETSDLRRDAANDLKGVRDADAVAALVVCLRDKDRSVRSAAANALEGDPRTVPVLVEDMREGGYPPSRLAALRALVALGSAEVVEPIADLLTDPTPGQAGVCSYPSVRSAAAHALAEFGDRRGRDILIAESESADGEERKGAIASLGKLGADEIPTLVKLLHDGSFGVQSAAAKSLAKLGWVPTMDETGAYYFLATGEVKGCLRIGAKATQPLMVYLSALEQKCSPHSSISITASLLWEVRMNRLVLFDVTGEVADYRVVPILQKLLEKEKEDVLRGWSDACYIRTLERAITSILGRSAQVATSQWIELMGLATLPLGQALVLQRLAVLVTCPSCGGVMSARDAYRQAASFFVCPRCGDEWLVRFLTGSYERNDAAHVAG
jgi:predicted RNA-binding Zn-ribbon protein involved in translation (DUF1610 family)